MSQSSDVYGKTEQGDLADFAEFCQTLGLDLAASPDATMNPNRDALARTAISQPPQVGMASEGTQQLSAWIDYLPVLVLCDSTDAQALGLPTAEMLAFPHKSSTSSPSHPSARAPSSPSHPSVRAPSSPSHPSVLRAPKTPSLGSSSPSLEGAAPSAEAALAFLPDYLLQGVLGEGGMGIVQIAEQFALQRQVAIKRLKMEKASSAVVRALLQEALLMGRLEHPNIIPVYAMGRDQDGIPLLVMKRIEGTRWRDMLLDKWHPAWNAVIGDRLVWHLNVLLQICNAVHFAHSKGIVHRDIKPENVMIGDFGEVYLLDWGIGVDLQQRFAESSSGIAGTPAYMAPEMVKGGTKHLSPQTDVYLLGATLHEIITGKPRHLGESLLKVMYSALQSQPFDYPANAPKELVAICQRAMQPSPQERYADVPAFRQALADFLQRRVANELCDAAASRLDTLHELLASPHAETAPGRIYRLFHECRFALEQALAEWPDNPYAQELRQDCLCSMVAFEIEQRNLIAAEALLPELSPPQADLEVACRELAQVLEDERLENERLRELAHDLDPSVSRRERTIVGVAMGMYILASTLFVAWQREMRGEDIFTHNKSILLSFVLLCGISAVTFLGRKRLLQNKFGRQVAHSAWIAVLFVLLHRILGTILVLNVRHILILDALLIGGLATIAAITLNPLFALFGLLGVIAAFLAAVFEDPYAYDILGGGLIMSLLVGALWLIWRRLTARRSAQQ